MAHKLGIEVIAEGVEEQAQQDVLAFAGCDFVQGFLVSRPIPRITSYNVCYTKLLRATSPSARAW